MLDKLKEIWLRLTWKKASEAAEMLSINNQATLVLPPQLFEQQNEIKQQLTDYFPEIKSVRCIYFNSKPNPNIPEEQQIVPKKINWSGIISNPETEKNISEPVKIFIVLTKQPGFFHRWLLSKSTAEYRLANDSELLKYADICINTRFDQWSIFIQEMKKIIGSKPQ